jgi:hypothetical protein
LEIRPIRVDELFPGRIRRRCFDRFVTAKLRSSTGFQMLHGEKGGIHKPSKFAIKAVMRPVPSAMFTLLDPPMRRD